jgi:uncharacterized protein YbaA (DUF1428 family)
MDYVEGVVAAVPTHRKDDDIRHAAEAARIFREHGAIRLVECWGDDVPDGETTSFSTAVQRRVDGNIVFSRILWPSREVRDTRMNVIWANHHWFTHRPDAGPVRRFQAVAEGLSGSVRVHDASV